MRRDLASPLWESFEEPMLTDGRLGRALKQMIATRVSYANACRYCSAAHSGRAKLLGVPEHSASSSPCLRRWLRPPAPS